MNAIAHAPILRRPRPHGGFTLIEVVCILLVIILGLTASIGLVCYGIQQANRNKGAELGLPTAISVAVDPQPLLLARNQAGWSYQPYDVNGSGTLTSHATGTMNGLYVVRTETSTDADIIASEPGTVYMRSAQVAVDVYDTASGTLMASYATRILHQQGKPSP